MLLRKADFDAVGGFDERYVNGAEDIDLCFKLHEAGHKIYLAPKSQVRHHVSLSRKQVGERNERNSRALFARWRKEIKRELARLWAARLTVTTLPYARNFYVCGRTLPCPPEHTLRLHIDVNSLQQVQVPLRENAPFNAGLTHPLLLNGAPNVFRLRVTLLDANGQLCGGGHERVVVGHFMVDEQVVKLDRV